MLVAIAVVVTKLLVFVVVQRVVGSIFAARLNRIANGNHNQSQAIALGRDCGRGRGGRSRLRRASNLDKST